MAFKEKESTAGLERVASRQRRQARERQGRQEGEIWTRDNFLSDLSQASAPISEGIDANPRDAARLRKSREQVREGEVHWGVEDDETGTSDAGG